MSERIKCQGCGRMLKSWTGVRRHQRLTGCGVPSQYSIEIRGWAHAQKYIFFEVDMGASFDLFDAAGNNTGVVWNIGGKEKQRHLVESMEIAWKAIYGDKPFPYDGSIEFTQLI